MQRRIYQLKINYCCRASNSSSSSTFASNSSSSTSTSNSFRFASNSSRFASSSFRLATSASNFSTSNLLRAQRYMGYAEEQNQARIPAYALPALSEEQKKIALSASSGEQRWYCSIALSEKSKEQKQFYKYIDFLEHDSLINCVQLILSFDLLLQLLKLQTLVTK